MTLLAAILFSACQPRQGLLPTATSTATNTTIPTQTHTALPSNTATATATSTPIPTQTPTPLPGLGVKTTTVIEGLSDFFTFSPAGEQDGQALQKGVSANGFTKLSLMGDPYLREAELVIDISKEEEPSASLYWLVFLENTTRNGKEAAAWIQENFREAVKNGQAEQTFENIKVTLKVSGDNSQIFVIKVEPASGS